jgi:hypothetical protein
MSGFISLTDQSEMSLLFKTEYTQIFLNCFTLTLKEKVRVMSFLYLPHYHVLISIQNKKALGLNTKKNAICFKSFTITAMLIFGPSRLRPSFVLD